MASLKYAVIIATYYRKNGTSLSCLTKVAKMLSEQTTQNFKIFLVGDDYENREEFNKAVELFPQDRIYAENLDFSLRDVGFKIRKNRWTCGGMLARHRGFDQAMLEGYDFYVHLDDDDTWSPKHLETLMKTVEEFPEVDFLYTRSYFMRTVLPKEQVDNVSYNNLVPRPEKVVHSATCLRLTTLGEDLRKLYEDRFDIIDEFRQGKRSEPAFLPLDMTKWTLIGKKVENGDCKTIFIPTITCSKLSDMNIP